MSKHKVAVIWCCLITLLSMVSAGSVNPRIVAELPHCAGGRHIPGLPRLGIPTFRITNGPVGVGQNDCVAADVVAENPAVLMMSPLSAKATSLPAAIALAATFDREAAWRFGDVPGRQSRNLAVNVMEAPGVNLTRMPHGGRNFEYFGEDPYLAGEMAVAYVKAVQSHGVIAMPKRLVGFDKVWLEPGESRDVEIVLDPLAANHPFGLFNEALGRWQNLPGECRVMVGTSYANIVHTQSVSFK